MVYDCFIFFNELDLLELRLHELAGVVDKFVLVEATHTHTNLPKPLYYQENRARFAAFASKIIHVVVDDPPKVTDPLQVEIFQRNCIARGLIKCQPDDFVLVSDLDEIPRATIVKKMSCEIPFHDNFFANLGHRTLNSRFVKSIFHRRGFRRRLRLNHPFVWRFGQTVYRYFLNCTSPQEGLRCGTVMLRYRDFSTAQEMRHSGYKIVPDAGWHFSWMGGVDRILEKARSYSDQRANQPQLTDPVRVKTLIESGRFLSDESRQFQFVRLDESFPRYLLEHPEKFAHLIKPVPL